MFSKIDVQYMEKALALAVRGRGFASPNPVVGACVVKNGKLVGSGFHECFGQAHAEVNAIRAARQKLKGATLYVTLEPCSTWGKTPPCTRAIIESGIKRVVIATLDPNPKHAGIGIKILRKAGIKTEIGLLRDEAQALNVGFAKWIQTKLPLVRLKLAQSLDGKIAARSGDSRWVSGEAARNYVHLLRANADAVLVGKNTALRDDPLLSVRHVKSDWQPWRIVMDPKGELPLKSRIFSFNPKRGGKVILVCAKENFRKAARRFQNLSVCILPCETRKGRIDLRILLKKLGSLGVTSLLVEGGGELAASFVQERLADELYLFVAPKIVGGRDSITSFEGIGVRRMRDALNLRGVEFEKIGDDFLVKGHFR